MQLFIYTVELCSCLFTQESYAVVYLHRRAMQLSIYTGELCKREGAFSLTCPFLTLLKNGTKNLLHTGVTYCTNRLGSERSVNGDYL